MQSSFVKGFLSSINLLNPLLKDHNLGPFVTNSLAWKIHSGIKNGTNEEVAIFIFDKKQLEKYSKSMQETICTIVRRDAQTLVKLRHPSILRVLAPLEETKTDMVIITEAVSYTLRALCTSQTLPPMDIVEAKKCAYDIADGLNFLHDAAKMVHRRICPDTIICTDKGEWKIAGFGFAYPIEVPDPPLDIRDVEKNPGYELFQFSANMDFLAPEMYSGLAATPASDVYALGRLVSYMAAYADSQGDSITESGKSSQEIFQSRVDRVIRSSPHSEQLQPLLLREPPIRSTADTFLRGGFFQDTNTRILLCLKNFVQQDDSSKMKFLKGLYGSMQNFTPRVLCQHVLPPLVSEIKDDKIAAAVLANVFLASQSISNDDFHKIVQPSIIPLLKAGAPISQGVFSALLENLTVIFSKTKLDIATTYLVPFVIRALSINKIEIIGEALNQLPSLIGTPSLTIEILRTSILPRLQFICQNAHTEELKVKTLNCFEKLVPIIERYLTLEFVMPALTHLSHSDRSVAISVGLIKVYEVVVQQFNAELLGEKLLPSLLPLTVDKNIDFDQFNVIMKIVKLAIAKLEQERTVELSQKRSMEPPMQNSDNSLESAPPSTWGSEMQSTFDQTPAPASFTTFAPTPTPIVSSTAIHTYASDFVPPPFSDSTPMPKPKINKPLPNVPPVKPFSTSTNFTSVQLSSNSSLFVGLETKSPPTSAYPVSKDPFASLSTATDSYPTSKDPFASSTTITPTKSYPASKDPFSSHTPTTTPVKSYPASKDPFASLNDLQDLVKARPSPTPKPASVVPPPQQNVLVPISNPTTSSPKLSAAPKPATASSKLNAPPKSTTPSFSNFDSIPPSSNSSNSSSNFDFMSNSISEPIPTSFSSFPTTNTSLSNSSNSITPTNFTNPPSSESSKLSSSSGFSLAGLKMSLSSSSTLVNPPKQTEAFSSEPVGQFDNFFLS